MNTDKQSLRTILKQAGFSATAQRLQVFDLLKNQEPMSVSQLMQRTAGKMDRASVYRTISLFERLGILDRLNIGWKYKLELSDKFAEHHHHLTCLNCHKIIPINATKLEAMITAIGAEHQFVPTEHQVEMQGYCSDCQNIKTSGFHQSAPQHSQK